MKKAILILSIIFGLGVTSDAQVNPHAIGVRGGAGTLGSGIELSYQHGFGESNRLELDLGASANLIGVYQNLYVRLTGSYHWVFNITSGLNWFIGPAVQLGSYHTNSSGTPEIFPTLAAGVQAGAEFDFKVFDIPLLAGVDVRPMVGIRGGNFRFHYGSAAFVRYTF